LWTVVKRTETRMGRRRRRRTRNLGLLLVLVLAVAGVSFMGTVFASWTDDAVVDGEVTTGRVLAGIYDYASWDPGPNYLEPGGAAVPLNPPIDGTADNQRVVPQMSAVFQGLPSTGAAALLPLLITRVEPGFIQIENRASTHSINLGAVLFSVDDVMGEPSVPFYGRVREEFNNVYPLYATGTTLVFGNGGTLPILVTGLSIESVDDPQAVLDYAMVDRWDAFLWDGDNIVETWSETYPPLTMPTLEEFLSEWPYGETIQLEPGRVLELGVSVYFAEPGPGEEFPEGAIASVEFEVAATLWCEEQS